MQFNQGMSKAAPIKNTALPYRLYCALAAGVMILVSGIKIGTSFGFDNVAAAGPRERTIVFIDNSVSSESYITSDSESQINIAVKMAVEDVAKTHPACNLHSQIMVGRNDPLNIFRQKSTILKNYSADSSMIVGVKNAAEMNLAANAFKGTNYLAVVSGAPTDNLAEINENFFAIANSIKSYAALVSEFIEKRDIAQQTIVVYPGDAFWAQTFSQHLTKYFKGAVSKFAVDVNSIGLPAEVIARIKAEKVATIVLPVADIQQAMPLIKYLKSIGYEGDIIGSSNWGRAMNDMNKFNRAINLGRTQIYFPNSWSEGQSPRSSEFEKAFKLRAGGASPIGTAVYTYDSTAIAAQYLCEHFGELSSASFRHFLSGRGLKSVATVRVYTGLDHNGLKSDMRMVRYDNENEKLVLARSKY